MARINKRLTAAVSAAVIGAALMPSAAFGAVSASPALNDATGNFPLHVKDSSGNIIQICDGAGPCSPAHDGAQSYFVASGEVGGVDVELALEATTEADGTNGLFYRQRVQSTSLLSGTWTVKHPYGEITVVGVGSGERSRNTLDAGCGPVFGTVCDEAGFAKAVAGFGGGGDVDFLTNTTSSTGYLGNGQAGAFTGSHIKGSMDNGGVLGDDPNTVNTDESVDDGDRNWLELWNESGVRVATSPFMTVLAQRWNGQTPPLRPDLTTASDTGLLGNDNLTQNRLPSFTTRGSGGALSLEIDGVPHPSTATTVDGVTTLKVTETLTTGDHRVVVVEAGNGKSAGVDLTVVPSIPTARLFDRLPTTRVV